MSKLHSLHGAHGAGGDKANMNWTDDDMPGVQQAWKLCVQNGLTFVDTAQAYGSGESERILGGLVRDIPRNQVFIQTKWSVVPDNTTNLLSPAKAPAKLLGDSLERLGVDYVDCYVVHGPIHVSSISQAAEGLAECVDSGRAKTVGVTNYSTEEMLEMQRALAKYGVPLATNQCEFSVLRRLSRSFWASQGVSRQ
jgi:aryl-alcohol dehydrogenase-like predicted oxidoreductase